jgi:hypothetical protein
MYTYGAGLQQAPDSLGFEHVVFAPPGRIIAMAVNNVSLDGNVSAPLRFATASKTTPRGTVGIRWYLPPPPPPHGSCFADVPAASGKDCGPGGCTPTASCSARTACSTQSRGLRLRASETGRVTAAVAAVAVAVVVAVGFYQVAARMILLRR